MRFLVLLVLALQAAQDDEARAAALLARAEDKATRGMYAQAVDDYEQVAAVYPDTRAGRIGAARTGPTAYLGHGPILSHGPSANRIDVVVLAEGFPLADQGLFDAAVEHLPEIFARYRVLDAYATYHNFERVNLASRDSLFDSGTRRFDTALDARDVGIVYRIGSYVTVDRAKVKEHMEQLPHHDGLALAYVRNGADGASVKDVAVVVAADERVVHEWGHVFAGLADERSEPRGHPTPEQAPNLAQRADPAEAPWKHWLAAGVPGIGMYEGAGGTLHGAWKPSNTCAMAEGADFCPVCREALVLAIYARVDPIDSSAPPVEAGEPGYLPEHVATGPLEFEVRVLRPTHGLDVRFWVLPPERVPPAPRPRYTWRRIDPDHMLALDGAAEVKDRRTRGPLEPIADEPRYQALGTRRAIHRFVLDPAQYPAGRYRVVCRVQDRAQPRDEELPWVLRDEHGVLESERAWSVVVP